MRFPRLALVAALLVPSVVACGGAVDPGTDMPASGAPSQSSSPPGDAPAPPAKGDVAAPAADGPELVHDPSVPGGTPFHLLLTNEDGNLPVIDVDVLVDGVEIVKGSLPANGSQHVFAFDLTLASGNHTITVTTVAGAATSSQAFDVEQDQPRWGVARYLVTGCSGGASVCDRRWDWSYRSTPPLFG